MFPLLNTISFILQHPLNHTRKIAALSRYIRWQVGSRLLPGPVAVPFADSTRLLVQPGMTGATGNVYCGLHEFEDMAFVLHVLRPGDLFADIGSNIGSYTVLAAGAAGAHCVSFEPNPATFVHFLDNIRLNNLESKVTAKNIGLGASSGSLTFTSELDCVNHVVAGHEVVDNSIEVPVSTLDAVLSGSTLTLMKIDVEGFETEVLNGAAETMQRPSLLAVVIELSGSGLRYGYDEEKIHQRMLSWGFAPARYDPFQRTITILHSRNSSTANSLYARNLESIRDRVRTAPQRKVMGASL